MTASDLTSGPHRYNLYTKIHKGLRIAQTALMNRMGSTDFENEESCAALLSDLRGHLVLAASHLDSEDTFIHPALEARKPGASRIIANQHDHHAKSFEAIHGLIDAVEKAAPADRAALGYRLYLRFSAFFADDLQHMLEEETVVMETMQSLYTDEELIGIEMQIVAAIPPEKMAQYVPLMAKGINRKERADWMAGVRLGVPAEVFGQILDGLVAPAISPADLEDLRKKLALAA
jgi:hypothetical protein